MSGTIKFQLALVAVAALSATTASAQLIYDNGAVNVLSTPTSVPPLLAVELRDGPGGAVTTLDVVAGAAIGVVGGGLTPPGGEVGSNPVSARVLGSSVLNVNGGARATGDLYASDNANVTISVLAFDDAVIEGAARLTILNGGRIDDDIVVKSSAHLEMGPGGRLDDEVEIRENATANFTGGRIDDDLVVVDQAVVTISNITIADSIEAAGNSQTYFNGGTAGDIFASENAVVNINGGIVTDIIAAAPGGVINMYSGGVAPQVSATLNGQVNLFGGQGGAVVASAQSSGRLLLGGLVANQIEVNSVAGEVAITGGAASELTVLAELGGTVDLYGGDFGAVDIEVLSNSVVTIYGTEFFAFGQPIAFGVVPFAAGNLIGTLADGSPLNATFRRQFFPVAQAGQIVLVSLPEPTAGLMAALAIPAVWSGRRRATRQGPLSVSQR